MTTKTRNSAQHSPPINGKIPSDAPDDVLCHYQRFYYSEVVRLKDLLIGMLEAEEIANPAEVKTIVAKFSDYAQKAIDISNKRLGYHKPKLANVEITGRTEHRYVIMAPPSMSWDEWAQHTKASSFEPQQVTKLPLLTQSKNNPNDSDDNPDSDTDLETDEIEYFNNGGNLLDPNNFNPPPNYNGSLKIKW